MPTLYLSQTATNGYAIGNDGTAVAGSKSTPWLTFKAAFTAASSGDTIVLNDGTYNDATYYTINKTNITISPENDGLVTFTQAGGGARVFHVPNTGTGVVFGAVVIDAQTAATGCITHDSTNTVADITLNGSELKDFTSAGMSGTKLANLTTDGLIFNSAACSYGVTLAPSVAGTYIFANPVFSLSNVTGGGIRIAPSLTGNTTKIYSGSGSYGATAIATPLVACTGSSESHVYDMGGVLITAGSGILINNAAIAATTYVYDNVGLAGAGGATCKYGIRIGEDTSGANNHKVTVKRYENNHVSGFDHSQMFGYVTDAVGFDCTSDDGYYGFLIKGCNTSAMSGMLATKMTVSYFQLKGNTSSKFGNCAYIISSGYDGTGILANVDGAVNNATSGFYNINCVTEIDPTLIADIQVSQDVVVENHNHDAEVAFTGNVYKYGASGYASASAFNAEAKVSNCTELASGYEDKTAGNYNLTSASSLVGAGTKWFTGIPPNTAGEPLPSYGIDIGHIQSTHGPFHPVNL